MLLVPVSLLFQPRCPDALLEEEEHIERKTIESFAFYSGCTWKTRGTCTHLSFFAPFSLFLEFLFRFARLHCLSTQAFARSRETLAVPSRSRRLQALVRIVSTRTESVLVVLEFPLKILTFTWNSSRDEAPLITEGCCVGCCCLCNCRPVRRRRDVACFGITSTAEEEANSTTQRWQEGKPAQLLHCEVEAKRDASAARNKETVHTEHD